MVQLLRLLPRVRPNPEEEGAAGAEQLEHHRAARVAWRQHVHELPQRLRSWASGIPAAVPVRAGFLQGVRPVDRSVNPDGYWYRIASSRHGRTATTRRRTRSGTATPWTFAIHPQHRFGCPRLRRAASTFRNDHYFVQHDDHDCTTRQHDYDDHAASGASSRAHNDVRNRGQLHDWALSLSCGQTTRQMKPDGR